MGAANADARTALSRIEGVPKHVLVRRRGGPGGGGTNDLRGRRLHHCHTDWHAGLLGLQDGTATRTKRDEGHRRNAPLQIIEDA